MAEDRSKQAESGGRGECETSSGDRRNFGGLAAALELKHELGEDVTVTLVQAEATAIDPVGRTVTTAGGTDHPYDLDRGHRVPQQLRCLARPGPGRLRPDHRHAARRRACRGRLARFPGRPRTGGDRRDTERKLLGTAYEFLFNMAHRMRKAKLEQHTSLPPT